MTELFYDHDADPISSLSLDKRAAVLAAVTAIEMARAPVPANEFLALADTTLRRSVELVLARSGRVLVKVGKGYLSGYDDGVAKELAAAGIGVLEPAERAVLTMIMLVTVAVPRAEGFSSIERPWPGGRPVRPEDLNEGRLHPNVVGSALTKLRRAGLVRHCDGGLVLGPQLERLTPATVTRLFEEMILIAEPQGDMAHAIRRLRAQETATDQETEK